MQAIINKAASVFSRLRYIWNSSTIRKETKIKLYSANVVPTALYACETWRKTIRNENKVNIFHRKCLRKIFKISYRDHVRNEDVLQRTGQRDLTVYISRRRLRLAGHVLRLQTSRPVRQSM